MSSWRLKWLTFGMDYKFPTFFADILNAYGSSAALKIAEVDLAAARTHVEQFKEISDANEAALQSLSNTHDEYRITMEAEIARHEVSFYKGSFPVRIHITRLFSRYSSNIKLFKINSSQQMMRKHNWPRS
jgi:hypothetical protein